VLAANYIADTLVALGVRHLFGVGGANIEDLFAAVARRRRGLRAVGRRAPLPAFRRPR